MNLGYPVDREPDSLIGRDEEIEEQKRNDAKVNEGRREHYEKPGMEKVIPDRNPEAPMLALCLWRKYNLPSVDLIVSCAANRSAMNLGRSV